MLFHTAGIEIPIWLPPLVAFLISFFTSMGGVSGAFLLLPFQVSVLGYASPSVSATNHLFNVVAVPGGVFRYYREGRMVWPLAGTIVAGTLPGALIGTVVRVAWLPDPQKFKLIAACVLLYVAVRMLRDLTRRRGAVTHASRKSPDQELARQERDEAVSLPGRAAGPAAAVQVTRSSRPGLPYTFSGEAYEVPFWRVFLLSLVVGIVGGAYGIGGGAIIAPFLVSFFGLPVYAVAGATLTGTFFASAAAVGLYQAMAPLYPNLGVAPDWALGALFGVGGMAGMYLGARCQRFVPATAIKCMLAGIMLITALRYFAAFSRSYWL
jgi:uncharacterized membrane protein YfcA